MKLLFEVTPGSVLTPMGRWMPVVIADESFYAWDPELLFDEEQQALHRSREMTINLSEDPVMVFDIDWLPYDAD